MNLSPTSNKMRIAAKKNIKERDYWLKQLSGDLVKSAFPYDFKNTGIHERHLDTVRFRFSGQLLEAFLKISNKSDNRLHMLLMAGLVTLLHKYTGNNDIILGMPIYEQEIQGEFVNTILPIRNNLNSGITFKQLLIQVRQTIVEAAHHQNYPMETLLYKLNIPSSPGEFSLFDAAVLLENIHHKSYLEHIDYNMLFSIVRTGQSLEGSLEYNASLYKKTTCQQIVIHFQQLFKRIFLDLNMPIAHIDILPEEERNRILLDFNNTDVEYPTHKTIHAWLEALVQETPDKVAVIYNDQYLSYQVLNEKANQLARLLREKNVKPDSIVGILMEPCLELLMGIFAILKAGGAFLPIDHEYPEKRILSILQDSNVPILLTREKILVHTVVKNKIRLLAGKKKPDILFLENMTEEVTRCSAENLSHINHPGDLLYLISTSGSTGTPKNLMMEHGNMINLLNFDLFETGIPFKKLPQFSSIGFDMSSHEICAALLTGGELYLIDTGLKQDVLGLLELMGRNQMNVVFWPPAFLKYVFSDPEYRDRFPGSIEHIITSGEQLIITEPIRRYLKEHRVHLHNHYGPAETHVVTAFTMAPPGEIPGIPPIGKPISNTAIYILDENRQLKPIGAVGELYISGANVGRGYLDRPELTAEKFIGQVTGAGDRCRCINKKLLQGVPDASRDGFHEKSPPGRRRQKIYKTGDLARWLPDGNIEFLGRADCQVKIRGFRIELGEIETRLMEIDSVKEAVVLDLKDSSGEKFLCAYIVPEKNPGISDFREILSADLPAYMIPSYFVSMDHIPLTANGKVDKKVLPYPELDKDIEYIAPRDKIEEGLAGIWSEVLQIEKGAISIDANFFQLGGHSLRATILITRIHRAFHVKLILADIFKQPTIRGLSLYIKEAQTDIFSSIEPLETKEYYPLSSAQKRIYILQQMKADNISYNNPAVVTLEGNLDKENFEKTMQQLIKRHETLRTSFVMHKDEPVQRVHSHEEVEFSIEYYDTSEVEVKVEEEEGTRGLPPLPAEPAERKAQSAERKKERHAPCAMRCASTIKNFIRPFDLSHAPLLRMKLIKVEKTQHTLMVDMHHIITDGTSQYVFIKEFTALYGGKTLTALRIQYKDFSGWQNKLFESREIKEQEEYWRKQVAGEIPLLDIPTDYPRPDVQDHEGSSVDFTLEREETGALKELAKKENATLYMVLLAIYNVFLSKISGQEDIIVGTPIAARRHADLHFIIGMFVNTLIMRNFPRGEKTFKEFLGEVRERTFTAFDNQDYPFEELVEQIAVNRDARRNPLFDVMFTWQNMTIQSGRIPEPEVPALKVLLDEQINKFGISKFDMNLVGIESENRLFFTFKYSTRLFKKETIERFATYIKKIVSSMVKSLDRRLSEVEIIPGEEKQRLLADFNDRARFYSNEKNLRRLFEEQVKKTPDHIALDYEDGQVTYNRLHKNVKQLAKIIRGL